MSPSVYVTVAWWPPNFHQVHILSKIMHAQLYKSEETVSVLVYWDAHSKSGKVVAQSCAVAFYEGDIS